MSDGRKSTFFRVQTVARDSKSGIFQTRKTPSGGTVVSIRRDTYMSAKKAAAEAMTRNKKQPA